MSNLKRVAAWVDDYRERYGEYPKELIQLVRLAEFFVKREAAVEDFKRDAALPLHYAVKLDANGRVSAYHIGTSIATDRFKTYLMDDSDFNSKISGWLNGFDGNDEHPCSINDAGKYCYDLVGK